MPRRYLKTHRTKAYVRKRIARPSEFDPRSFRTKTIGKGKKLVVGCPEDDYSPARGRCLVGMKAQALLVPRKNPYVLVSKKTGEPIMSFKDSERELAEMTAKQIGAEVQEWTQEYVDKLRGPKPAVWDSGPKKNPLMHGKPSLWYPKKGSEAAKDIGSILQKMRGKIGEEKEKLKTLLRETRAKWMAREGASVVTLPSTKSGRKPTAEGSRRVSRVSNECSCDEGDIDPECPMHGHGRPYARTNVRLSLRGSEDKEWRDVEIPQLTDSDIFKARADFKQWVKDKDTGPLAGSWGALMDWWMTDRRPSWKKKLDAIDQSYVHYAVGGAPKDVRVQSNPELVILSGNPKGKELRKAGRKNPYAYRLIDVNGEEYAKGFKTKDSARGAAEEIITADLLDQGYTREEAERIISRHGTEFTILPYWVDSEKWHEETIPYARWPRKNPLIDAAIAGVTSAVATKALTNPPAGAIPLPKALERQLLRCPAKDRPEILQGITRYYDFHGIFPPRIVKKNLDHAKVGLPKVAVGLGLAADVDYNTKNPKSVKFFARGRGVYEHKFEKKPLLISDPSGKVLAYLPSKFRVRDWIHG